MATDFSIEKDPTSGHLRLQGALDLYHASEARVALKKALRGQHHTVDVSDLTKLDTVGALLLKQLQEKKHIQLEKLKPEFAALFNMVAKMTVAPPVREKKPAPAWKQAVESLGKRTVAIGQSTIEFITFLGQACVTFSTSARSWKHLRVPDVMHHIEDIGIAAVPIISLMAFMISVVIAYQGIAQLRPMGAENLTVNLVAISVLREMGVLLTAIMVAGRSGSAFTAEIGVMKVREEVDALQVIGIQPFEVLVLPRIIALLIALPLLTFLADLLGLLGGGVMCHFLIDIPLPQYMQRVREVVHGHDLMVGLIKAPVFALVIGMVGCMHGMKVSGSAESVGRETTASVVKSIFLVLILDAVFSVLFDKMGI